ncbi:hypothetical protein LSH36_111g02016 [Paralvinella palmiformis]|uniref:Uncharacterized protein n=1 Tax=Paralvinella palmiformis TaxID=53620 RepID=A0AAD9JYN7_9ANNE|nr:hypothetical protein LSH36_111g02016 [Paralvinella palmiformis]
MCSNIYTFCYFCINGRHRHRDSKALLKTIGFSSFRALSVRDNKAQKSLVHIIIVLRITIWCSRVQLVVAVSALLVFVACRQTSAAAIGLQKDGGATSPRDQCSPKKAELSCIVGCFKCAQAFGRKTYDMSSCCSVCQKSKALLIDDGPEFCSSRFFIPALIQ